MLSRPASRRSGINFCSLLIAPSAIDFNIWECGVRAASTARVMRGYDTIIRMKDQELIFRVHAIQRMFERNISETEVRDVLKRWTTDTCACQ
ncbi:MAG: DUF4258 domain-containing protein [Phycisphaerae bacterium]